MPFLMIRDDITKVKADALVNPANEGLLEGSGTSRAIYLAAGEKKLAAACRRIGHCDLGKAVATRAYKLQVKYIIHAVGPVWTGGEHNEEEYLYSAYRESMLLAKKLRLKSIAFPLLSSGNYGYPKNLAMKTAIRAISDFLMEKELLVYLVLYDRSAVSVSRKLFTAVEEYIDDHYVEQKDEEIYSDEGYPELARREFRNRPHLSPDKSRLYGQISVTGQLPPLPMTEPAAFSEPEPLESRPIESEPAQPGYIREDMVYPQMRQRSLEDLLRQMNETFSQMLLRLIDERGLKDSYVYKKANVDRRHFSKIRNDRDYAPNKKTVLAFAIALELSMDETKDLL